MSFVYVSPGTIVTVGPGVRYVPYRRRVEWFSDGGGI